MYKSKSYHINDDKNIALFFPTKIRCKKKLSSTEYSNSSVFISGGLCFRGDINLERFLDAMHHTLQDFDFIFYQLYRSNGEVYADYSTEDKTFIQLEIEKNDKTIDKSTLASIVPSKIDERIRGVVTNQFEGLHMAVFKITNFKDGFTIGYYLNHAFFDQSSLVYFMKYLSYLYTFGKDNISLKKPYLVDLDYLSLSVETPEVFKNLKDFRENSEAIIGFKYIPETDNSHRKKDKNDDTRNTDYLKPDHPTETDESNLDSFLTVDLIFNTSEICKLKDLVTQYLSVNDIIHAILLKIYTFNPDLPLDEDFCFGFACNMRKYCGLGEESIGNILSHPLMFLKLEEIKKKTIIELALLSRQSLSEISLDFFKKSLVWHRHLQLYHENPLHYLSAFNLLSAKATNWSTFDYNGIQFDAIAPTELKAPCLSPFRVNVISFNYKENEKIFKSSISVPPKGLESLRELEQMTKLFSYSH